MRRRCGQPFSESDPMTIRTITLFDQSTGALGAVVCGSEEDIAASLALPYVEGSWDRLAFKVDLETLDLVPIPPRAPMLYELRQRRNELLDTWRWTIMPDSPLTPQNQAQWLVWLKSLQSCLRDVTEQDTASFTFPAKPDLHYQPE